MNTLKTTTLIWPDFMILSFMIICFVVSVVLLHTYNTPKKFQKTGLAFLQKSGCRLVPAYIKNFHDFLELTRPILLFNLSLRCRAKNLIPNKVGHNTKCLPCYLALPGAKTFRLSSIQGENYG